MSNRSGRSLPVVEGIGRTASTGHGGRSIDVCSFRFDEQFTRFILQKERLVTPSRINRPPTAFGSGLSIPVLVTVAFRFLPMLGYFPFIPDTRGFREVGLQRIIRLDRTLDLVQPVNDPLDLRSRNVLNRPLEQDDRSPPKEKDERYENRNQSKCHGGFPKKEII